MKEPRGRVAYSPKEFAEMFGKQQTWGYRQIYAGKVTTITEHGRILIPAAEVDRILAAAGIYNGEKKKVVVKKASKAELWKKSVVGRRKTKQGDGKPKPSPILARIRPPKAKDAEETPTRFKKR